MRKSTVFLSVVLFCILISLALAVNSARKSTSAAETLGDLSAIAASLHLTDVSFSTDARYTRHPSQADLFSAFQDAPASIEHFPSGSVVSAPDFSSLGAEMKVIRR